MSTSRVEAFSDGVFAIAITLLILEIRVPEVEEGELWRALRDLWPSYAAFGVSFLVIGIVWVNHHAIWEHVVAVDRPLLFVNLALLGAVAFLPFPTALLATYIQAGDDAHVAAAFYSGAMAAIGITFAAMWNYSARTPQLLHRRVDPRQTALVRTRSLIGPVAYGVLIAMAFVSAPLTLALHGVLALFYAMSGTRWLLVDEDSEELSPVR